MKYAFLLILFPFTVFSQIDTCKVEFIYDITTTTGQVKFMQKDEAIVINSFLWDFGDGATSTNASPTHLYSQTGSFIVCLTVQTSNGCTSNFCDTLIIEGLPQIDYNLSGTVVTNTSFLPMGFALLIKQDYGEFEYTEIAPVIDGNYHFFNIDPGLYLVYIVPVFNVPGLYYPFYLPTYSGNAINWQHAAPVQVFSNNAIQNIHLASFNDIITGNRSVSGKVSYTNNAPYEENIFNMNWMNHVPTANPGNNATNISVLLYNVNGICIKSSQTDSAGEFNFVNLPYGKYYVMPEKAGVMSYGFPVNIETTSDSLNYYYITLNSNGFVGVEENVLSPKAVKVFPNPAENDIFVPAEIRQPFTLYSSQGSLISTFITGTESIDISNLNPGLYVIKWQSGERALFVKE